MVLQFSDGEPFATGAAPYAYRPAAPAETTPRIILTVRIGSNETSAFVDTGGVYLLCSPEIVPHLNLDPDQALSAERLLWRNHQLSGKLYRVQLTLLAEQGHSLAIEATAFVPDRTAEVEWSADFPSILGMSYCLERIRFAVDPASDTFYFGGLSAST